MENTWVIGMNARHSTDEKDPDLLILINYFYKQEGAFYNNYNKIII